MPFAFTMSDAWERTMTTPDLTQRLRDFIDTYRGIDELGFTGLMTQAVAEIERTARNRDMWQEQCRVQADELERLRHSKEAQRAKLADVERRLRNQRDHINRLRAKAGESCN